MYVCACVCMHDSVRNFDPNDLKFGLEVYFASDSLRIANGPDSPRGFTARAQKPVIFLVFSVKIRNIFSNNKERIKRVCHFLVQM